jgi:hypothetical protein
VPVPISELVAELRRQLPAPVAICRDAVASANGDVRKAYDLVIQYLYDDLVARTGLSDESARTLLSSVGFDVERAIELWGRDNPPPALSPRALLAAGGALAAQIPHSDPTMRRYVHVIPRAMGYEIRLIVHHARFTERAFGSDYDLAMQNTTTRVYRLFADDLHSAMHRLINLGGTEDMLVRPDTLDSCLLNGPIDTYLELPHLQLGEATDPAIDC